MTASATGGAVPSTAVEPGREGRPVAETGRRADPDYVSWPVRLGWSARALSLAANIIILGYFSLYATDTLGMNPALLGTLMLASKLFDGLTDLVAGWMIDRTHTRWGRARPYEFAMLGLWISIWALFSIPAGLPLGAKAALLFVLYTLVNSVFATLAHANQTLYTALAFPTRVAIGRVSAFSGMFISVGVVVISVIIPQGLAWAGKDPGRWSTFILALAVPMAVLGMMRFVFVKESVVQSADTAEKVTFREIFAALRDNKWIWIIFVLGVLQNLLLNVGAAAYYFRYIVGDIGLQSWISLASLLVIPAVMAIPPLMKRFKLSSIIIAGQLVCVLGNCVLFLAGTNIVLLLIGSLIIGVGTLPLSYMIGILIIDCATYNEWRGHRRLESVMGAVQSFSAKIGTGLGLAAAGAFLGAFGYDGGLDAQPDSAVFAIRALFTWIPALIALLMVVTLRFYKLEDLLPQINQDLAERRAAQGIAAGPAADGGPANSADTPTDKP
ncbi:MFS transporter [Actinomyces qiguomingii]|uniref:MFS transporter n=1 Tax=Actinomyces qiguomingii TaxID=2057800 RepID=UPI000CA03B3A|nr:MFS transporter [Actinomyces qiguomingii]